MEHLSKILNVVKKEIINPIINKRTGESVNNLITYSISEPSQVTMAEKNVEKQSVFSVKLFKLNGIQWVFDDDTLGIKDEAFVMGADDLIDRYMDEVLGGYNINKKYVMNFSTNDLGINSWSIHKMKKNQMPTKSQRVLGSNWECKHPKATLWLCPTFFEYYTEDIKKIYFQIKSN